MAAGHPEFDLGIEVGILELAHDILKGEKRVVVVAFEVRTFAF